MVDKIKQEVDKLDLKDMDNAAIKQSLSVLSKVQADYLVIDLITKLKEELNRRKLNDW